jgi:hypothetical protein
MAAAFSLALAGEVWHNAHYAAPATSLLILIVVMGMRRLRLWRWRCRGPGLHLVRLLPIACALMLAVQIASGSATAVGMEAGWRWPSPGGVSRANILKQLERGGEKHLVFVRYEAAHDTGDEWVYNDAEIDQSRVVWARELDRESNANLMRYFEGRRVWLVEPDRPVPRAVPYSEAPAGTMPFVQIGAPGIGVLRSAEALRRKILQEATMYGGPSFSCDGWNFIFTAVTGVDGPNATGECYGNNRSQPVSIEQWFSWLLRQK